MQSAPQHPIQLQFQIKLINFYHFMKAKHLKGTVASEWLLDYLTGCNWFCSFIQMMYNEQI